MSSWVKPGRLTQGSRRLHVSTHESTQIVADLGFSLARFKTRRRGKSRYDRPRVGYQDGPTGGTAARAQGFRLQRRILARWKFPRVGIARQELEGMGLETNAACRREGTAGTPITDGPGCTAADVGRTQGGSHVDFLGALLTRFQDYVLSVGITPDGQWIVSGSKDRSIQFWQGDGQAQFLLQGHKNSGEWNDCWVGFDANGRRSHLHRPRQERKSVCKRERGLSRESLAVYQCIAGQVVGRNL